MIPENESRSSLSGDVLDGATVRRHFERAAPTYDEAAVVPREVASRLLERLDLIRLQPHVVLDLGAGTGVIAAELLKRYRGARVYALDSAFGLLSLARKRGGWRRRPRVLQADACALPLATDSVDMVVSNLMLPWCLPPDAVFAEVRRVLAPGGLWLFTTLGPDTLIELRRSWEQADRQPHVYPFMDMHDVGDALLRAGFADPVMDVERLVLTYAEVGDLLRDLHRMGASNALSERARGLTGRERLGVMRAAYERLRDAQGRLPASWEVVYGLAWRPTGAPLVRGEARVPLASLKRRS